MSPSDDSSFDSREAEIEERVAEILELPEAEQPEAFAGLRKRFRDAAELLVHWEQAARAIRTEPGAMPAASGTELPDAIGGYRIESVLGEGGMGTVYLAEQTQPVQRQVALKVVKLGMDTKQILSRFELERKALAMMNHDAIAKVFDVGQTDRGQSFFVMEYAPGVSITSYCDEHRLSIEERVELFQQVCQGVQHAHQKGVIHRDLKPSNLLVVRDGHRHAPKIIDFGLARALDNHLVAHSVFTEHGQFVGTPEYMSPEQASFDTHVIDTRTDVYSLGVVLYELLAGELPFSSRELRRGGYSEIGKRLRESEPQKPSTRLTTLADSWSAAAARRGMTRHALSKALRGDLDWIVLKAMAKEPERRYGSANELAQDLGRYLAHEPVVAGPPSTWYRLRKLVRRNRLQFAAATAVLFVLIGGVIGTLIGMFEAQAQTTLANDRAEKLEIEALTAEQVARFFIEMFEVSNPSEARGNSIKAREILDRSAAKIDTLADQPIVRARLSKTMGDVYRNLGLYEQAEPLLRRAIDIRRKELGDDHPETLAAMDSLGKLHYDREEHDAAERLHGRVLEARRRVLGDDAAATLSSMNNYGLALRDSGKGDEAFPWLRRALDGRRRVLGASHRLTLTSLMNMGQTLLRQGKVKESESYLRETLQKRRHILGDDHPDTLISINDVGLFFHRSGNLPAAERHYREAWQGSLQVLGEGHRETLTARANLANALLRQRRLEAAEEHCVGTLNTCRRKFGGDDWRTDSARRRMIQLRCMQGRGKAALPFAEESVDYCRRAHGPDHTETLDAMHLHASVLSSFVRDHQAAESIAIRVVAGYRKARGADDIRTLEIAAFLAKAHNLCKHYEKALAVIEPTVAKLEGRIPATRLANIQRSLAECLSGMGRLEESEKHWLEIYATLSPHDSQKRGTTLAIKGLVRLYDRWGKPDKAAAWRAKLPGAK